ncbi:MAG: nitrogenase [Euryarchaeota archaeon]|nr:nitrogenase [Euryarchaeota archaeon]MBU4548182.1 nitrogenase [Euryarchaeota archaeon]MBU4608157.1 nitrogenase [Euryarchaeota archaeon]MBV1728675.1 nitrogenase [Methanobacterium sp.]MBV1755968.1 nitrogenase [Methanobacterium sp.]
MQPKPYDPDHKIDLDKNTCPNREQRANGTNVYYGKATQLIEDAKAGKTKCFDRELQQTSGCVLNFYLTVRVSTIRDAAIIYHGPLGCSSSSLGYREIFRSVPPELGRPQNFELNWITTNLQQSDVVYGASQKLKNAVLEAQKRYDPKAIFILTTCTSGVIGEDIEGAVNEIQPEVKAKIVPVHCEGVRSRLVQTGYDAFWHGVLKYLVKKPEKIQKDLVNVASMLSYTWQDRLEIKRLLGKVGLRVNFIPEFASVNQLEELSEAAVTAPLCPTYTDYLSRGLKQEFDVPYFLYPSPVGIKNTEAWLRQIGKYTGKEEEIEALIKEENKIWAPKLKSIRERLLNYRGDGKRLEVLGSLGQGRLLSQIPYFDELGLSSSAGLPQDFDNLILEDIENMVEDIGDFDILVSTFQAAEQGHITRNRDPDITLTCPFQGGAYKREKSVTRLHALRGDPDPWSTQSGYAGAIAFGEFILQSLENKAFENTMKEKTADSYKDSWYEQPNPLKYVDRESSK